MSVAQQLVNKVVSLIIAPAILVLFSLAFLLFVWGIVQFLKSLNDGKVSQEGKNHMLYGVLGMFVMVSVFGIISLISNTFGLGINANGSYNPDMSRLNNINTPSFGNN